MKNWIWLGLILTACSANNSVDLASTSRLEVRNEEVQLNRSGVSNQSGQSVSTLSLFGPTLTLVGHLAPPTVNGSTSVHASDVVMNGSKVYVAYNTAGLDHAGGIDVIDVGNPAAPALSAQELITSSDINRLAVGGGYLYLTGATAAGETGAFIDRIALDANGLPTTARESRILFSAAQQDVPAQAGVSLYLTGSRIYSLSGSNGGLTIFDSFTFTQQSFTAIEEARDLGIGAGGVLNVLTGKTASSDAHIAAFDASAGAALPVAPISLMGATVDSARSSLLTGSTAMLATAGRGGVSLICLSSPSVLGLAINPTVTGLTVDETSANGVAFGNGLVYVANGGAGVAVYSVQRPLLSVGCNDVTLNYEGRFTLGAGMSANNVYFSNGWLVVATGAGGFHIIRAVQGLLSGLLQVL